MRRKCGFILTVILVLFAGCANDEPGGPGKPEFSITIGGPFDNGTISVKGALQKAGEGETITLTAAPDNCFRFASVTVKGEESGAVIPVSGAGNERDFAMPPEPVKVTQASFQLEQGAYGITMSGQYYNGMVTSTGGDRYKAGFARAGDTVTLLIVPDEGYYLSSAIIKGKDTGNPIPGSSITIDNTKKTLTFTMPDEDVGIGDFNNGLIFSPVP